MKSLMPVGMLTVGVAVLVYGVSISQTQWLLVGGILVLQGFLFVSIELPT